MRPVDARRSWTLPVATSLAALSLLWAVAHLQLGGFVYPEPDALPAPFLMMAALVLFARAWLGANHLRSDGRPATSAVADWVALLTGMGAYVLLGVATLILSLVYASVMASFPGVPASEALVLVGLGLGTWATVVLNWPVVLAAVLLCPVGVVPCVPTG